jgi:hypothetical protein
MGGRREARIQRIGIKIETNANLYVIRIPIDGFRGMHLSVSPPPPERTTLLPWASRQLHILLTVPQESLFLAIFVCKEKGEWE